MAILDYHKILSNNQAITTTAASGNVVDLGSIDTLATDQYGFVKNEENLVLNVVVSETFVDDSGSDGTLAVALTTGDADSLGTTVVSRTAQLVGVLTAGAVVWRQQLPRHGLNRYIGLTYTVANATFSAGKVYAYLSAE